MERYKNIIKKAKKSISDVRFKAYDDLYHKLSIKDGEMSLYKLARIRDMKCRDLEHVRCIKSEDTHILIKDKEITKGWQSYFKKLLMRIMLGMSV